MLGSSGESSDGPLTDSKNVGLWTLPFGVDDEIVVRLVTSGDGVICMGQRNFESFFSIKIYFFLVRNLGIKKRVFKYLIAIMDGYCINKSAAIIFIKQASKQEK